MLLEPPVDKMTEKIGNPFVLAILVGKRAKYLASLKQDTLEKEVTRAITELYEGKILGYN